MNSNYIKAKELLLIASSQNGFLASAKQITNYNRVWARDGVICGLAALLDGDSQLTEIFKNTLETLAAHQHKHGNIPSNVYFNQDKTEVSFGGLAGRVDTIPWFIIGICNYVHFTNDHKFLKRMISSIEKGLDLLECWEFNNNDLVYVPRSGNWADEYITEGHILYDQLLRLWALRAFNKIIPSEDITKKIHLIEKKIKINYRKHNSSQEVYHPNAYKKLPHLKYWAASITPSGYQIMYDGFANSLAILLDIDSEFNFQVFKYSEQLRKLLTLQLIPAFWEPIEEESPNWNLLVDNCKYEFRNSPHEFHNGGTWQVVNGFYAAAISSIDKTAANDVLKYIRKLNKIENYSFYENFNSKTGVPNGVPNCTWSAAGEIIATQFLNGKKLLV